MAWESTERRHRCDDHAQRRRRQWDNDTSASVDAKLAQHLRFSRSNCLLPNFVFRAASWMPQVRRLRAVEPTRSSRRSRDDRSDRHRRRDGVWPGARCARGRGRAPARSRPRPGDRLDGAGPRARHRSRRELAAELDSAGRALAQTGNHQPRSRAPARCGDGQHPLRARRRRTADRGPQAGHA